MVEIKFKKLVPEAVIPSKGTEHAACFDLTCTRIKYVKNENGNDLPNKAILYFGLACEIPVGYKMDIQPRSSFTLKGWVMANTPGKIDCDYRGELQMRVEAIPQDISVKVSGNNVFSRLIYAPLPFKVGDRTCQAEIMPVVPVRLWEALELSETVRGEGGFGHTGK